LLLTPERDIRFPYYKDARNLDNQHAKRDTAILRTSKQIHDEAATVLYGYSRIILSPHWGTPPALIISLPQRYCDLILDVTLKGFDKNSSYLSAWIKIDGKLKVVRSLFRFINIKRLTIELVRDFYEIAWCGGTRFHRMEETPGIKELLQIRGVEELKLIDLADIPRNYPHLIKAKIKLEKLLRKELLKPRRH
jgi:hypothetical protein